MDMGQALRELTPAQSGMLRVGIISSSGSRVRSTSSHLSLATD